MYDVLAPGKLVLTLRSTPPFVAESAFALVLTILLAAPLIVRIYLLLDKPLRALTKTASVTPRRRRDCASRSLLIHYPAAIEVTDSTSSYSLHPESPARRINSTPTLQSGELSKSRRGTRRVDGEIGDRGSKIRKCPPSSFADSRHPVIDISSLDYKVYRHKLIDATLRKQYDNFQPPGDVVLNSLHLNSTDSVIGVRLNDRYDHSLFDFVEEYYDVVRAIGRKNVGRPHPLDHFVPRGGRRPRTSEKETETIPDNGDDRENSRNHLSENVNGNPPESSGVDDNGNPCVQAPPDNVFVIATGDRDPNSEMPILRRPISRSRKRAAKTTFECDAEDDGPPRTAERSSIDGSSDRPASVGNASRIFSLSRAATSPGDREATGSARPGTSAGSNSRESRKKLEDYPPAVLPLSGECCAGGVAGGRSNFISVSSSEIASIRSDSSKCRDDEVSCRSRESSISPRNRASSRPPWLSGSRGTSFNRKYGRNITETSAASRNARPMSARGSAPPWQKLPVLSRGRSKESSLASTSHNPRAFPERRAASFVASRGKEFIGMTVEKQEREGNFAIRPRGRRSKSKDGIAVKDNEEGRTSKTTDYSPCGKKISARRTTTPTSPDSAALSSPGRALTHPRKRSPRAAFSVDAPATVGKTWATKKPELITSRCDAEGARGRPIPGRSSPARDRRENQAKLNRDGRQQLRSTENPSKGASLSPQIELSAEVLNPADDDTNDKSAIPDSGKNLTELTSRIDPRGNAETAGSDGPRAESAKMATRGDVKSNSANDVTRSRVPKIIRNLRARPVSANNLRESHGLGAASPPAALQDANSETESGLNGAKLNTRSNGAADEMRYSESPSARASPPAPSRDCGNAGMAEETRQGDIAGRRNEELQLPRQDSKIGLAMNSALKRYIKMLKQGLLNHGDKDGGVALASLSLSDAISILSEQRTSLSPEEIQELQAVLDRIERNPELLCKLSCPSMESVV